MSIRARLAALFTLAFVVITVSGSFLFVSRLQRGLLSGVDSRLDGRIELIMPGVTANGPDAVRLTDANAIYAQVLDARGHVRNSSHGLAAGALLSPAQLRTVVRAPVSFDRSVRIRSGVHVVDTSMRLRAVPVSPTSDVLVVATSEADVDAAARRATVQLGVLCAVILVVALAGGWMLTRAALRPVERMRREAAGLGVDRLAQGIAVPNTRDEIARLGQTFNDLLRRAGDAAERERAFVSDAGHELRTPLAILKGELELAQKPTRTREELRQTVGIAAEETDRLIALAEDLLFLARGDEAPSRRVESVDVVTLLDGAVRALGAVADARAVSVTLNGPASLVAEAERDRLRRAFDNVLINAVRVVPPGGWVRADLGAADGQIVARVTDNGPGFPPEFLPRAFERFSRVPDTTVPGNGLGLAIVQSVMEGHGGRATVDNLPEGGAVVTLRWPATPDDANA